jgi:hypothetical protein
MVVAANHFLETLDPQLRAKASFPFDSDERFNWHFIPRERFGVSLKEMNLQQRRAAHTLMRTALSTKGYLKATAIMSLEPILRALEHDRPDVEQVRDEEKYWFSIFGEPSADKPWGWRVEGHHLSLNFSSVDRSLVASLPAFFGANPAEVKSGPRAGLRVLAAEEDLARVIMASLTDAQKQQAVILVEAPRDIITAPGHQIDIGRPAGLPVTAMTDEQKSLLRQLVQEYAHNLRRDLASAELESIKHAGIDKIHFAWAGSLARGEGHYYRIHGPTFIIEYDNTQNDANHIHTVWHSMTNDFGHDLLRKHYEQNPHKVKD